MLLFYILDLCGTGTGSVHMFEWSTPVPVVAGFTNTYSLTTAGMLGQFPAGSRGARVTALQFDDSGYRVSLFLTLCYKYFSFFT